MKRFLRDGFGQFFDKFFFVIGKLLGINSHRKKPSQTDQNNSHQCYFLNTSMHQLSRSSFPTKVRPNDSAARRISFASELKKPLKYKKPF